MCGSPFRHVKNGGWSFREGQLRDATEKFVRDALTRALSDPEVLSTLNSKEREQYLDGLVFSG